MVRIFHWTLVAAFGTVWLTADELQKLHEIAGYGVADLIALRVFWGILGSRYARFTQFIRDPEAAVRYIADTVHGRERRYIGHNPTGAVMIVAMLITLTGTAFTGWMMADPTPAGRPARSAANLYHGPGR